MEWSWVRPSLQFRTARINIYNRPTVVAEIRTQLQHIGDDVYQQFRDCCFGHFMDFDHEAISNNVVLHSLMAREVTKADGADDETWFRVGKQLIRFSKYEYALVTGLTVGQ